jgi:hypothetical protein
MALATRATKIRATRIFVYFLAVIASPLLERPWMIAAQAAMGGLVIGLSIGRLFGAEYEGRSR